MVRLRKSTSVTQACSLRSYLQLQRHITLRCQSRNCSFKSTSLGCRQAVCFLGSTSTSRCRGRTQLPSSRRYFQGIPIRRSQSCGIMLAVISKALGATTTMQQVALRLARQVPAPLVLWMRGRTFNQHDLDFITRTLEERVLSNERQTRVFLIINDRPSDGQLEKLRKTLTPASASANVCVLMLDVWKFDVMPASPLSAFACENEIQRFLDLYKSYFPAATVLFDQLAQEQTPDGEISEASQVLVPLFGVCVSQTRCQPAQLALSSMLAEVQPLVKKQLVFLAVLELVRCNSFDFWVSCPGMGQRGLSPFLQWRDDCVRLKNVIWAFPILVSDDIHFCFDKLGLRVDLKSDPEARNFTSTLLDAFRHQIVSNDSMSLLPWVKASNQSFNRIRLPLWLQLLPSTKMKLQVLREVERLLRIEMTKKKIHDRKSKVFRSLVYAGLLLADIHATSNEWNQAWSALNSTLELDYDYARTRLFRANLVVRRAWRRNEPPKMWTDTMLSDFRFCVKVCRGEARISIAAALRPSLSRAKEFVSSLSADLTPLETNLEKVGGKSELSSAPNGDKAEHASSKQKRPSKHARLGETKAEQDVDASDDDFDFAEDDVDQEDEYGSGRQQQQATSAKVRVQPLSCFKYRREDMRACLESLGLAPSDST
eukprot:m.143936 g.143936  ORF g.143936 m.143936 type:complete len:655 (-) comp10057_c0_seq2:120-2084(-)